MIYSLNGTLIYKDTSYIVVECGGVGYKCLTTLNTLKLLPQIGSDVMIYTHMLIREDAIELCGFSKESDVRCFKMLTSVSGVGAKVAIALLSELQSEQIASAIAMNDTKTLTKASGVGNKLAQRIILELKDKIKDSANVINISTTVNSSGFFNQNVQQAIIALEVLGYASDEVSIILAQFDPSLPVEELIKLSLKKIGEKR